jgi:hypothetical protein
MIEHAFLPGTGFMLRSLHFMRRMVQVRISDWAVRTLVTVTLFAYFFAPEQCIFPLMLVCTATVGIWALLYPEGVIGWVKSAHAGLDVNDSSIWWVPRLIGACFLFFVLVLALAFRGRW